MHLSTLIGNLAFVIAALTILGACGWSVVAPFRRDLPHAVLVAPLAGILMLTLSALAGYVFLKLPMRQAGIAGMCATAGLSLFAVEWTRPWGTIRHTLLLLLLGLTVSTIAVRLTTATSLQFGETAMLYLDGTDHLGYAHLADWLNDHTVTARPVMDPGRPYESWPALILEVDPRFGSFAFLALLAQASGHSAMFTYDLGTAVVMAATLLAVAGVYARSMVMLWLLIAGLFACHWFDYGRSGYFGKILGYPSAFMVVGLYLCAAARKMRVADLVSLVALAAGGALMHSGMALAMFVGLIGGSYLVGSICLGRGQGTRMDFGEIREKTVCLALVVGTALLAAGTLARPVVTGYPDWNLEWNYILPRIADLEAQGVAVSRFSIAVLQGVAWGALGIMVVGGLIAFAFRVPAAIALLIGPLVLLAVLYGVNARAFAFQMIGTFYPFGLCGLAVLWDELAGKTPTISTFSVATKWAARAVLVLALVGVGLHLPRFFGAVARYSGPDTPRVVRFAESQMNRLAGIIGSATVDVDIPNSPQLNIALLVEFGRRNMQLQWQLRSWRQILGYQPWEPPPYASPGVFRLVAVSEPNVPPETVVFRTEQYLLLRPAAVVARQ